MAVLLALILLFSVSWARETVVSSEIPYEALVDSMRALGKGDTLTFRPGEYTLPGPLYFRSHTLVRGTVREKRNLTLLKRHRDFRGPYDPEKTRYCWNETYRHWEAQKGSFVESLVGHCSGPAFLDSLTVRDLRIEGYPEDADIPAREQPFDLVRLAGNRVALRNLEVRHSRNGGILLFGGSGNVIEDCVVENTARDGIFVSGIRNIAVRNNTLRANRDNSIAFDCQNVAVGAKAGRLNFVDCGEGSVISGNLIENGRSHPHFRRRRDGTVMGYNYYGWTTSGSEKDRAAYASGGIYLGRPADEKDTNGVVAKVKGISVTDNRILGAWLFGIRLDHGCENITIRDNTISAADMRLYAIGLDADDGASYPRNVRLIGNVIRPSSVPAVAVKRNRDVWFAGNMLQGRAGRLGIRFVAGAAEVGCREDSVPKARIGGRNVDMICP